MRIRDWSSDVCSSEHDAALANARDELFAIVKGRSRPPEAKPDRVSEIVDVRCASGRGIEDARARQMVLEEDTANALLRSLLPAERSFAAGDPAHLMGFVEGDDPFEVRAGPVEDLLEPAMVAADGSERWIGDEQDALFEGDGFVDRPVRPGLDVGRKAPRSEEQTSALQSLMRNTYAVFRL